MRSPPGKEAESNRGTETSPGALSNVKVVGERFDYYGGHERAEANVLVGECLSECRHLRFGGGVLTKCPLPPFVASESRTSLRHIALEFAVRLWQSLGVLRAQGGCQPAATPSYQGNNCVKKLGRTTPRSPLLRPWLLCLPVLLLIVVGWLLPLRTAVQIGADEGFELGKATLCLKGHQLYTEVWNDQPPLHTFLITQVLRHVSPSVLAPRLITVAFAGLLLLSVAVIARRFHGDAVAAVASLLLLVSPGFIELSSSCMLEIPSLATAVAALALLVAAPPGRFHLNALLAGSAFGLAIGMKLVPVILGPCAALMILLLPPSPGLPVLKKLVPLIGFGLCAVVSFIVMDLLIERGAFLVHFQQSWVSHFGPAKSFEHGSAADHPFEWAIFLKNWDLTIPAIVGIWVLVRGWQRDPVGLVPVAWLGLMCLVFTIHRPWWSYYYVHLAVPLTWCAAVGYVRGVTYVLQMFNRRVQRGPKKGAITSIAIIFTLCALAWSVSRVWLQIGAIRNSPRTTSAPIVAELRRYQGKVDMLFTEATVYSFHSGIPLPPDLAVLPLKRFWSGEMTAARLGEELKQARPGLILLPNDSREVPYQDWLLNQYRLVYQDSGHLLYLLRQSPSGVK